MDRNSKVALAMLAVCGILLLTGCPTHTSIAKINEDPGRFLGKEVTVAGRVSGAFGALGSGIFQIDYGSGNLWVYSQNYGVPSNGAKLSVTGRIEQGFNFAGRNFATILRETQRRH